MSVSNDFARISDFEKQKEELVAIRRHLHTHPELSHEEAETSRYVADKLKGWGYEVVENIGGHRRGRTDEGGRRGAQSCHPCRYGMPCPSRKKPGLTMPARMKV